MADGPADVFKLFKQLEGLAVKRAQLLQPVDVLSVSAYTFQGNYAELITFLGGAESNAGADPESLLREISRLLHNFLASASTLVDHTRKMITVSYASAPDVQKAYNAEKQVLVDSPLQHFVKDLRNYTVHQQLPVTGINTQFTKESSSDRFTVSAEAYLDSGQLKGWQNWTTLSQQYLATAPAQISVRTVVEDYYALVNRLYTWLQTCLKRYHQDALSTLEARKNEIVEEIRRRGISI